MDSSESTSRDAPFDDEDSLVCYCFRQTTRALKECYRECGSLKKVEEKTRAGTACAGCKIALRSLFNEEPSDQYEKAMEVKIGSACSKPGSKVMKGFIVHDHALYSRVYSSNAVAPQLGVCDTSMRAEYALIDHKGVPVLQRSRMLNTNETFVFDTRDENLDRPFYGMFILQIDRQNFGASRFNIYWNNERGQTATHELGDTGRPKVFVPLFVDEGFLRGPNTVYLGLQNPHQKAVSFRISAFDVDSLEEINWDSELGPFASSWIDASKFLYGPAVKKFKNRQVALKVMNHNLEAYSAITTYMFAHNRKTDLWTANHL